MERMKENIPIEPSSPQYVPFLSLFLFFSSICGSRGVTTVYRNMKPVFRRGTRKGGSLRVHRKIFGARKKGGKGRGRRLEYVYWVETRVGEKSDNGFGFGFGNFLSALLKSRFIHLFFC